MKPKERQEAQPQEVRTKEAQAVTPRLPVKPTPPPAEPDNDVLDVEITGDDRDGEGISDGEEGGEDDEEAEPRKPTPPRKSGKSGIGPPLDLEDAVAKKDEPEKLKLPGSTKKGKRQGELPGFENKHLEDLEDAAREYARLRDDRMFLTRKEADQKEVLMNLMKKHSKTIYRVEEMEISIVVTEQKIKVRILEDGK